VRERDLRGHVRVVVADIGAEVVQAVLQLDVHPGPELLDIKPRHSQSIPISAPIWRASSAVKLSRSIIAPSLSLRRLEVVTLRDGYAREHHQEASLAADLDQQHLPVAE
jgi:hypothetical protein